MKKIIRDYVWKAGKENEKKIERYFDQEKQYINGAHKDFDVNFERKQTRDFSEDAKDSKSDGQTADEKEFLLNFKNDPEERKKFYESSKDLIGEMWEDDAVILEAILKHLQIIQDSLSDKLKKIIHYEIFYSTKVFVEKNLTKALIEEWKRNKDVMSSDESQTQKIEKLKNDIKNNKEAREIVRGMTEMIREFQIQDKIRNNKNLESSSEPSEAMDDVDESDEEKYQSS